MKISQKFANFDSEVNEFVPYAVTPANVIRLRLSTDQTTACTDDLTDWNNKYGLYKGASTHTEQTVIDINNAYDTMHQGLQNLKKQIKNDATVELTGADYTHLHIHQDASKRHHIPTPDFVPMNTCLKLTHLVAQIFTSNPNPPHETENKLPVDVDKIGRKIAIVKPTDPEPAISSYHNLEAIGSVIYDIVFDPLNEGAKVWLITCYINARGEEGPSSKPMSFPVI